MVDKKGIGTVVVLLVLGLFGFGIGGGTVFEHNVAIQEGQPTEATVVGTDIEVSTDDDGDKSYHPVVEYEYTVDGEQYTEDNVFPGQFDRSKGSRSWAEDIVSQYDPGEEIEVNYRPNNPGEAYVRNDGLPGTWFVAIGYALVALFGGSYLIRQGFRRRKQRQLMADTPTEQAQSLSMGPSEITGTAETSEREPAPAPFTDEQRVVAKYKIEEYDDTGDDEGWKTVEEGVKHMPFYVDDGTGQVPIWPDDEATFDLEPEDWKTVHVDNSEAEPGPVDRFIDVTPDVGYPSGSHGRDGDRRYKQNLIKPGEEVYVFGTVQPREDGGGRRNVDNLEIRKVPEDDLRAEPMFLISDDSETDLIDRRRFALWRVPVGVVFAVTGVALIVGTWGPSVGISMPILF